MVKFGGRTKWLAHQLLALHLFFKEVNTSWKSSYVAQHRLIHLEQSLSIMSKVFGLDGSWIPDYLSSTTTRSVSKSDWALEGLSSFAEHVKKNYAKDWHKKRFGANAIAEWAQRQEEFSENNQISNSRSLGRYIKTHKHLVAESCNLIEDGCSNNRQMYRIIQ